MPITVEHTEAGTGVGLMLQGEKETVVNFLGETGEKYYKYCKKKIEDAEKRTSRLPNAIKWVPGVINILDDAQDMLITALLLGKPLLKKLGSKAIPGLGWALTVNDILNAITQLLAESTMPGLKICPINKRWGRLKQEMARRDKLAADFLKKKGWRTKLAGLIQGLQAVDNLTGKGLKLGSLMGGLNDIAWDAMRGVYEHFKGELTLQQEKNWPAEKAQWDLLEKDAKKLYDSLIWTGKSLWRNAKSLFGVLSSEKKSRVVRVLDSYKDGGYGLSNAANLKAARVLIQGLQMHNYIDLLDDDELITIITAQSVASNILTENENIVPDDRADAISMMPFPLCSPIQPEARQALIESGISPDDFLPGLDTSRAWPTIAWATHEAMEESEALDKKIRAIAEQNPAVWGDVWDLWANAGENCFEAVTGDSLDNYRAYPPEAVASIRVAGMDIAQPRPLNKEELIAWLMETMKLSGDRGLHTPGIAEWRDTSIKMFGSYRRKAEI